MQCVGGYVELQRGKKLSGREVRMPSCFVGAVVVICPANSDKLYF